MTGTPSRALPSPARVVIAGGGIAAIETVLALKALAAERANITVIAPAGELDYRPLAIRAPFSGDPAPRLDLSTLVEDAGARHVRDALERVDPRRRLALTDGGLEIPYDVLVVAVGAVAREPLPGALTFRGTTDVARFRVLLERVSVAEVRRLVFALPPGVAWSLPLYELALQTAAHLRELGSPSVELSLVTPESEPLAVFGPPAAEVVERRLAEAGVELLAGRTPASFANGRLLVVPHEEIEADAVVTLAVPDPRRIPGVPSDARGFLATDEHGRVVGMDDVYAAGDITAYALKQGGLAAQQADAVAQAIAARLGAPVEPQPFKPVLRGLLLTGGRPAYMRSEPAGGKGDDFRVDAEPLWWPAAKIAARYLGPFLALHAGLAVGEPSPRPEGAAVEVASEIDRAFGDWHPLEPAAT